MRKFHPLWAVPLLSFAFISSAHATGFCVVGGTGVNGCASQNDVAAAVSNNFSNGTDLSKNPVTPTGGTATTLSAMGAAVNLNTTNLSTITPLVNGAFQSTGGTLTGNVNLTKAGGLRWSYGSNLTWDGGSNNLSLLQGSPYISGFGSYAHPVGDMSIAESIKNIGDMDFLWLYDRESAGATGNRNVIQTTLDVGGVPGSADTLEGSAFHTLMESHQPTLAGSGWPISLSSSSGGMQGAWMNNIIQYATPGLAGAYGQEIDLSSSYGPTTMPEYLGLAVVNQSGQLPSNGWNVPRYGVEAEAGIDVEGGWGTMYAVGKPTGGWSGTANSDIFKTYQQEYGGVPAPGSFLAHNGVDFRGMTFTGSAFTSPGYSVSPTGAVSSTMLQTGSGVQASTATVSGATIVEGGLYEVWPTFTVEAPPMGGTTATVTATTLGLLGVDGFLSTGRNYKVNDVLTPSNVTLPASGGVSPAFTVSSVDANGGITGGSWTTLGNATDHQAEPVTAMTGGSGTGAMFFIPWQVVAPSGNVTAWSVQPTGYTPAATGSGFKVGDTFGPSADGGTPGSLTVSVVSADGGIMMPTSGYWTVANPGSITSISSDSVSATTTSGSGKGAYALYGYTVTGVSTTPGSGYLPNVQPVVTASQASSWHAKVRTVMTPTVVPLVLNPGGGTVNAGPALTVDGSIQSVYILNKGYYFNTTTSTTAIPVTFSAPASGGVQATGFVSQVLGVSANNPSAAGSNYVVGTSYPITDAATGNYLVGYLTPTTAGGLGNNTSFTIKYSPMNINGSLPQGPFNVGTLGGQIPAFNYNLTAVTITNAGVGYSSSNPPNVTFSSYNDGGSLATGVTNVGGSLTTGNLVMNGPLNVGGTNSNPVILPNQPSLAGINVNMLSQGDSADIPGPAPAHHGIGANCVKQNFFGSNPNQGEMDCINIVARQDGLVASNYNGGDAGDMGGILADIQSTLRAQNFTGFMEEHTSIVDTRNNTTPYYMDMQEGVADTQGAPNADGTVAPTSNNANGQGGMQAWFAALIDGHGSGLKLVEQSDTSPTAGKLGHGVIDYVIQAGHYTGEQFFSIDGNGNIVMPDGGINLGTGSNGTGGSIFSPYFALGTDTTMGNMTVGNTNNKTATPYILFNGWGTNNNVELINDQNHQLTLESNGVSMASFSATSDTFGVPTIHNYGAQGAGSSPSATNQSGWQLGWNASGGNGETDFFNRLGGGSTGGFNWYDWNTTTSPIMTLNKTGTLRILPGGQSTGQNGMIVGSQPAGYVAALGLYANAGYGNNLFEMFNGTTKEFSVDPNGNTGMNGTLNVGGDIISTYLVQASGNAATPTAGTSGASMGWNVTNGGGETDFFNMIGSGNSGGFNWYDYTTSTTPVMTLSKTGALTVGGSVTLTAGQNVYLDKNQTMWVQEDANGKVVIGTGTTRLFSIDNQGNVLSKGTMKGGASP